MPLTAGAVLRAPWRYVRRGPFTAAYLVVLVVGHAWLAGRPDAGRFLVWLSTDLDNLARHPVGSLAGSLLVVNGPLRPAFTSAFGGTLITLVLGVGVALWWLERRAGTRAAAGVLVVGHVGATLLTAVVIRWAVAAGRYPPTVRSELDVGISYGAQAALAAVTVLLPRRAWLPWAAFVVVWPLADADWFGWLPDFTTVGHLISAALGAMVTITGRTTHPAPGAAGPATGARSGRRSRRRPPTTPRSPARARGSRSPSSPGSARTPARGGWRR